MSRLNIDVEHLKGVIIVNQDTNSVLYQKTGMTISNVALSLLSKSAGDRIPSVSHYQQEFGVSRGTIQNALNYLKEAGAIVLNSHGHMGAYIEKIDYLKLQDCCLTQEMLGIMPLPYSLTYEGFATAICEQLKKFKFNMAYARGAAGRMKLVETGTYQFAICSQYAAEHAIESGKNIEVAINFGYGSFVSKHVLLLRDKNSIEIRNGMRVAYNANSLDYSGITGSLVQGKDVKLVDIRTQQILSALADGVIDAAVWNYDNMIENHYLESMNIVFLEDVCTCMFATAVMVVQKGNAGLKEFLRKHISKEYTLSIMEEVRKRYREPYF